jgi:hypothetical protein
MATATNYNMIFRGLKSGRTLSVSAYTADTAGAINTFGQGSALAASGGLNYVQFPEDVILEDVSIPTGMTQTHTFLTEAGVVRQGTILSHVVHVSTAANRPKLGIPFRAGALIGATTI